MRTPEIIGALFACGLAVVAVLCAFSGAAQASIALTMLASSGLVGLCMMKSSVGPELQPIPLENDEPRERRRS
jgi:hypothetical protein